ncbi:MAG: YhbD family protein [Clostridia bacterium]|nr:YhbD family protein [Clostridia bacterium]
MDEYISKKDLLAATGISYGQLYRWKRENLIPEEWFIKRSSYTGQETYFPREKILERIDKIQQLKDRYPLEDLARMLSPELTGITYRVSKVIREDIVDGPTAAIFQRKLNKEFCSFWEACVIKALGTARFRGFLTEADLERLADGFEDWEKNYKSGAYMLFVMKCNGINTVVLSAKEPPILLDRALTVVAGYDLDQIGAELKSRMNVF